MPLVTVCRRRRKPGHLKHLVMRFVLGDRRMVDRSRLGSRQLHQTACAASECADPASPPTAPARHCIAAGSSTLTSRPSAFSKASHHRLVTSRRGQQIYQPPRGVGTTTRMVDAEHLAAYDELGCDGFLVNHHVAWRYWPHGSLLAWSPFGSRAWCFIGSAGRDIRQSDVLRSHRAGEYGRLAATSCRAPTAIAPGKQK